MSIGKNRRRCRPRLTAPALELLEEYVFLDTDSEDESIKKKIQVKKRKVPELDESDYDLFADEEDQKCKKSKKKMIITRLLLLKLFLVNHQFELQDKVLVNKLIFL